MSIGNDKFRRSNRRKPKWPSSNWGGKKKNGAKYVDVSAGSEHTCALVDNGSYECIGHDGSGRSNGYNPKWPSSNRGGKNKDGAKYVQVSAGDSHTCAFVDDGSYECIGNDEFGRSNGGDPKAVGFLQRNMIFSEISTGKSSTHTCALVNDGSYECIGSDFTGRSNGHNPKWPSSNPYGKNKNGAKYVQVSAGSKHTCALVDNGSYECIGHDGSKRSNRYKPKWPSSNPGGKKKKGAKYVQVSAGSQHTCALVDDGSYECIGHDGSSRSNRYKPKWPSSNRGGKNKDGAKYVQVSAGDSHTCALVNDGSYKSIGSDKYGRWKRWDKRKKKTVLIRPGQSNNYKPKRPES